MDRKWDSPKEYLSQIRYVDQRINNKRESIDALWAKATRVNKPLKSDMVQESGSFDTTALIDKVIDLQQETNEMIECLIDLKRVIEKEIHDLDNPLFVVVLYQRYVLGKQLNEISITVSYEDGYVRKVHGWALQEFKKKYPEKF